MRIRPANTTRSREANDFPPAPRLHPAGATSAAPPSAAARYAGYIRTSGIRAGGTLRYPAEPPRTEGTDMLLLIWGLRVIYRTLGQGVFFCRRCGGDREYRHRAGRRFITVFFIPLIPLAKTGEHVQCLTCKTRYVTEVLKLPTTAGMQLAVSAGMRALVVAMLRVGDP